MHRALNARFSEQVDGREAFLYMQCNQCHTIVGEDLPEIPFADPPYVELGGRVSKVKTYGELVTAIINPSHKLADGYPEDLVSEEGESKMYVYNGYMTVVGRKNFIATTVYP
jgi:hypothetical protein